MKNRPLFKKSDGILIGAALLCALLCLLPRLFRSDASPVAVVTSDGDVVAEIVLDGAQERTIRVGGVTVFVKDGEIGFLESDCPDKICVRTGALRRAGESAACVPNRVAIVIRGEKRKDGVDVVAY